MTRDITDMPLVDKTESNTTAKVGVRREKPLITQDEVVKAKGVNRLYRHLLQAKVGTTKVEQQAENIVHDKLNKQGIKSKGVKKSQSGCLRDDKIVYVYY